MTFLKYVLAILVGSFASYVFGILYGILMLPSRRLHFHGALEKHFNKIYLHLLWFLSSLLYTAVAYMVLKQFNSTISFVFIFLLFLRPALLLNSRKLRKPENAGYFNFLNSDGVRGDDTSRYTLAVNTLEALTRISGIFLCLLLLGLS